MPRGNLLLIVFDNVRMRVSFYCDLHCAHCHIPEVYRDQFNRLMGLSQFSLEETTALTCRSCLRNVPGTGDDQPFNIVFLRVVATGPANKQGLQVQPNPGGLGPMPSADVTSIFDDRERLTFLLSPDRAEGETLDRFRGGPSVWALALRRKVGAGNGLALVQARMTVNRRNLSEAPDAYLGLSSIGIDPSASSRCLPPGVTLNKPDALLSHYLHCSQLCRAPDLPAAAARQTDVRLLGKVQAANQPVFGKSFPTTSHVAQQPHVSLADAA